MPKSKPMAEKTEKSGIAAEAENKASNALYSIGDLASEFDISTRTIRFYESKGLLSPKRVGSNRIYTKRDRARLILILRGKRLGFSLEEIAQYLDMYDADPNQMAQIRLLLQKVERSVLELEDKQRDIADSLKELREIREQCIARLKIRDKK